MTSFTIPIPTYQCHKRVQALRIKAVVQNPRGYELHFEDERFCPMEVHRHGFEAGGYFMVFEDGSYGWLPAAAFEAGYTLVDTGPFVIDELGAEFNPVGPATQAAREVGK